MFLEFHWFRIRCTSPLSFPRNGETEFAGLSREKLSSSWFYYYYYPLDLHFSSLLLVFLYPCFSCFVGEWKSIISDLEIFFRSYIRYIQFWVEIDTEASFAHFRNERDIVKWRKFNAWCSLVADYELRGSIDNGWKGWKRMGNEQVLTILIILAISMRP